MYYGSVRVRIMNLRRRIVREAVYLWRVRGGDGREPPRSCRSHLFNSREPSQGNNTKCAYVTSSLCGGADRPARGHFYSSLRAPFLWPHYKHLNVWRRGTGSTNLYINLASWVMSDPRYRGARKALKIRQISTLPHRFSIQVLWTYVYVMFITVLFYLRFISSRRL